MRRWAMPRLAHDARRPAPSEADARFRASLLPHLDGAYGYARYLCRDATAAEDIVQEAFLRAFRSFDTCRGSERAWLMTIVRNCYHDWARNHSIGSVAAVIDIEHQPDADAERAVEEHAEAMRVRGWIAALPEPFREALVLRELEGFSYREIGEATGAPIGTVMSRLARAREMLAAFIGTGGGATDVRAPDEGARHA